MRYIILLSLIISSYPLSAQWSTNDSDHAFHVGLRLGHSISQGITNLPQMVIPPPHPPETYMVKMYEPKDFGLTGNFFIQYIPAALKVVAFEGRFGASRLYGGYDYEDINGLMYEMRFKYWYADAILHVKIQPALNNNSEGWLGFYVAPGLQLGLNFARDRLTYFHSPEEIYGPSKPVEDELKRYFEGDNYLGWTIAVGWDKAINDVIGFSIEGRWYQSFGDMIKTLPGNPYGFPDRVNNHIRPIALTAGIAFRISK